MNVRSPQANTDAYDRTNMTSDLVYVLRHEYELDGYDTMKILGVYSTEAIAESAKAKFIQAPGFRDHPDGFMIEACKIDQDLWSEGFVTVRVPLAE